MKKKSKKKEIEIKIKLKSRIDLLLMQISLFGFRGPFRVTWKDFKQLFYPQKLRCLYG